MNIIYKMKLDNTDVLDFYYNFKKLYAIDKVLIKYNNYFISKDTLFYTFNHLNKMSTLLLEGNLKLPKYFKCNELGYLSNLSNFEDYFDIKIKNTPDDYEEIISNYSLFSYENMAFIFEYNNNYYIEISPYYSSIFFDETSSEEKKLSDYKSFLNNYKIITLKKISKDVVNLWKKESSNFIDKIII